VTNTRRKTLAQDVFERR